MSGGFVPGLSAWDTFTQILAWALVFGYAQQLLTRLVDQRANSPLQNVGGRGPGRAGDEVAALRASAPAWALQPRWQLGRVPGGPCCPARD
jgi:hypothetical protein